MSSLNNLKEQMNQVIDTNVKGIFHMLKVFLPAMKERNRGQVDIFLYNVHV